MKDIQLICFSAQIRWVNKLAHWSLIHRSRLQHDWQPLNEEQTVPKARVKSWSLTCCWSRFDRFQGFESNPFWHFSESSAIQCSAGKGEVVDKCVELHNQMNLSRDVSNPICCDAYPAKQKKKNTYWVNSALKEANGIMWICRFSRISICVGAWVSHTQGFTSLQLK